MSALQEIAMDLQAERMVESPDLNASAETGSKSIFAWGGGHSIGRKILFIFGGNILLAIAAAVVVLVGMLDIDARNTEASAAQSKLIASQHLLQDTDAANMQIQLFAANGNQTHRQSAVSYLDDISGDLEVIRSGSSAWAAQFAGTLESIEVGSQELKASLAADQTSAPDMAVLQARVEALHGETKALNTAIATRMESLSASISELIWSVLTVWGALVIALCLTGIFTQLYFHRHVGQVIGKQADQMTKLAQGDRDIEITGQERSDEIGAMSRALEVFYKAGLKLERLSLERAEDATTKLEEQEKLEAERERIRVGREEMLKQLADQFEGSVGEVVDCVAAASTELQNTSRLMAETAEVASTRTHQVSVAMAEANSGATAAAAASDEFAMSIGEISRQAASSAELARHATDTATQADNTISELSTSADQVGEVVELISTIAKRTNLLALNASIEAARGGEAGRGFAVVASEVKELAMQTSRATEQVAEQIRAMQERTGASVTALRSITGQVQQLENTAVSIASAVDQQSVAGQDLARSIDLAARGTDEVSTHIEDVREMSLSTGSAATQVLSSSSELEIQAATLRDQMGEFLSRIRAG